MSKQVRLRQPSRRPLLAAVALLLVTGLLSAGPAAAHKFTRTDPNDTPGLLDLRSAGVAHKTTVVVHSFRTFAGWAPSDLGRISSFFVIGIDKNNDPRQAERCVLIFFAGRLRARLINCITGSAIGPLPVSKPNRTTVKVNIPKTQTGLSYRWAVVSFYVEKRPCLNGCVDGIPNLRSFILHDLIPPTVSMDTDPLRVWEVEDPLGTDASFKFPFTVADSGGSGVKTWTVQRHPIGSGSWTNVVSGTGGGAKTPTINGVEGTRFNYRVLVTDKHGNRMAGPARRVYIPTDDADLDPADFLPSPTSVPVATAFGGSYSEMAASDVFTYDFTPAGTDCRFELVGPGGGDWSVSVVADEGAPTVIAAPEADDRLTLYSDNSCATTYVVTVDSGSGFAIDAVLGS